MYHYKYTISGVRIYTDYYFFNEVYEPTLARRLISIGSANLSQQYVYNVYLRRSPCYLLR